MKISRRDTIIIASLMNVSLLALLFATSNKIDDGIEGKVAPQPQQELVAAPTKELPLFVAAAPRETPVDEIDQVLQEYALKQKVVNVQPVKAEVVAKEEATDAAPKPAKPKLKIAKKAPDTEESQYYVIKSGDSPWKVAKKLGIKYEDLLKLNNLTEEKAKNLKIGQKIRIK